MSKDYYDEIISLKQEAAARQQRQLAETAQLLSEGIREEERAAAESLARGDHEGALASADWIREQERELAATVAQLPAPERQMSEAKRQWVEQRLDLVGHPQAAEIAGRAHNYIVGHMGIQDDSEQYFECMSHLLEPPNYEPMPTPDSIIQTINATSKHKIDAKSYNRGVEKLLRAKASGGYPDKQ